MKPQQAKNVSIVLILLLFFMSGALALVYQVVWSRMMMQVFGSTAIAVGTVLAAFMTGMASGSWTIGKIADKSRNCLRLYAWLEIGIALTALLSHLLLSQMEPAYPFIYRLLGSSAVVFAIARFAMAFVLVALPTFMMGATLPVLTRFLAPGKTLVGINLSTLYASNTFGAVAGVLLTGFFLIGEYGIHVPVYLAIAGNLLIGGIAWMASTRIHGSEPSPSISDHQTVEDPAASGVPVSVAMYRVILIGLGISGLTSFAYEIYWTRSLVFILGNSTYALTTMLSAFLTGIALGGYLVRFLLQRIQDRAALFGWIQVLLGVVSALALPLLFSFAEPQSLNQYLIRHADQAFLLVFTGTGVAFLVMLIPAILIGSTFPLVGQIGVRDLRKTGASVGRIYAINTIGNVLGALLPGFVLLSWLGIQKGILLMATLNVTLGFVILFLRMARPPRHPAWRLALAPALIVAIVAMTRVPLDFQFPSDGERDHFQTLYYREGPLATTKVYINPHNDEKHISVDGIVIGGTGYSEFKQLLLAHLPKLLLDDISGELTVGLGSGILAGESIGHPRVKTITGVEIETSVVAGANWFEAENNSVLDNPRMKLVVDDIGNFLRTTHNKYQVISADEKTADEYASNGFSYSLEYYDLLKNHLAPGGLVAQWVPTTLPPRQYHMVLKTFSDSFPYMQLWYFLPAQKRGPFNTLLIGSNERIQLDYQQVQRRFEQSPEAYENLVPYGLTSAEAVLPHFVAEGDVIRKAVNASPTNSLDHPRYEFFYPWDYAFERGQQIIANHSFLFELKREAYPAFLASLESNAPDRSRLRQTLAAEFRYLMAFQKFLAGMPIAEQYQVFDDALAVAPWNDSLRARIYAQYSYIASTRGDPAERARLMKKASDLYKGTQPN